MPRALLSRDRFSLVFLLAPFLGLWTAFWLIPSILGLDLSFRSPVFSSGEVAAVLNGEIATKSDSYVGLDNYRKVLDDPRFWKSLCNSFFYVTGSILVILPLSLVLALNLLSLNQKIRPLFAFCLIIPGLAMPGVLSTLFYLFFHGREGALNQYLILPLGLKPINWMMDPNFILPSMVLQSVWRWTGMITLFLLSGLEGIPKWQLESARIEGLDLWERCRFVWLPGVRNLMLFSAVFLTVEGFASFSGAYSLLGGSGGIMDSGLLFVTYLYQVAFPGGSGSFDFPAASAMSLLVVPVIALFLFWVLRMRSMSKMS